MSKSAAGKVRRLPTGAMKKLYGDTPALTDGPKDDNIFTNPPMPLAVAAAVLGGYEAYQDYKSEDKSKQTQGIIAALIAIWGIMHLMK